MLCQLTSGVDLFNAQNVASRHFTPFFLNSSFIFDAADVLSTFVFIIFYFHLFFGIRAF